jgi:hypothetical protein
LFIIIIDIRDRYREEREQIEKRIKRAKEVELREGSQRKKKRESEKRREKGRKEMEADRKEMEAEGKENRGEKKEKE